MTSITLKKKITTFFVVFLTALLTFCLFFFYKAVRDEMIKENLGRIASYCKYMERILISDGLGVLQHILDTGTGGTEETVYIRVTILNEYGNVLFESSDTEADLMATRMQRQEIRAASEFGSGSSLRYSHTRHAYMLYYALRVAYGEGFLFIRAAMPLSPLSEILSALIWRAGLIKLLIGGMSFIFWIWLTNRLFRPLEEVITLAELVQNTDITETGKARFPIFRELELQRLSIALNTMSEHLRKANANIQARRDELARIVDALPIGVLVIDDARRIRYLNDVTRYLFGEKSVVAKGSPVELLIRSGEIYDIFDGFSKLNGADGQNVSSTVILHPLHKKEAIVDVRATALGSGWLMTFRDVTEERKLEETRRNFTIDAGHELQTPLTAIRAAAELLLDDMDELREPEKWKLVSTVMRQQERMTSLIDDLLLLVKLETAENAEGSEPERTEEDLMEMLSLMVEDFRENPAARHVEFTLTSNLPLQSGNTAPFKANRPELLRAFSNIIDNAVRKCGEKYGERGGGRVRLTLRRDAKNASEWVITIEDNGPGVEPETANLIFREFYSSRARERVGHGLGLSISARVIKAHGGAIDLLAKSSDSPKPDNLGGAVFEIRLPAI